MPVDLTTYQGVDLIGDAARNEFRAAMMDVKATFHKTIVTYWINKGVFDRFNEARQAKATYETHDLDAFVEYSQLVEDKYVWTETGAEADARVKVTFNTDYLDQMGLWDNTNNVCKLNGKEDRFFIGGKAYRIVEIPIYEGPIEARNIHTIIYGEPDDGKT